MIKLVKIELRDLRKFVKIGFEGDTDLVEKYHIAGGSLEACIESTVATIYDTAETLPTEFWAVKKDDDPIGFTVIVTAEQPLLYSFAINVDHRDQDTLGEWYELVREICGGKLSSVLWKKNTRAINFLKKKGLTVISDDTDCVYLSSDLKN